MPATPLISIAIPTYNRCEVLSETLSALAKHPELLRSDIELVISDNASSDNTESIIFDFSSRTGKHVVYQCNESNLGIDANIHAVSHLATGRYLLLMSDDDFLRPGALSRLTLMIEETPDLLFCFVNGGSFSGQYDPSTPLPTLVPVPATLVTQDFNKLAQTIWIWSTFISAFFIERKAWIAVRDQPAFFGTDIYLTHVLFRVLTENSGRTSIVTAEQLIAARMEYTGNFRIFHAFGINFMKLICQDAPDLGFSHAAMRSVKLSTIRRGLPPMVIMVRCGLKPRRLSWEEWRMLFKYIWWEPVAWFYLVPLCVLPQFAIDMLIRLKRLIIKRSLFS